MLRGLLVALISAVFIFSASKLSFAQDDHLQHEHGDEAIAAIAVSSEAVNVDNKICPVSGEKIDEKLKVTYEYQGKVYNFCCASCVEKFKKDPDKYIKKIEEEKVQRKSGQEETPSGASDQHSH